MCSKKVQIPNPPLEVQDLYISVALIAFDSSEKSFILDSKSMKTDAVAWIGKASKYRQTCCINEPKIMTAAAITYATLIRFRPSMWFLRCRFCKNEVVEFSEISRKMD